MVLIIGSSSGLGKSLSEVFSEYEKIITVSRSYNKINTKNIRHISLDITKNNNQKLLSIIKPYSLKYVFFTVGKADWKNDNPKINIKSANSIINTNFYSVSKLVYDLVNSKKLSDNCLICFCSSVSTILPRHRQILYCASKTALNSFIKSLRFYFKLNDQKYRVSNIMLGYIDTKMNKSINTPFKKLDPKKISKYLFINRSKLKNTIYFPKYWIIIKLFVNLVPEWLMQMLFKNFFYKKKYF